MVMQKILNHQALQTLQETKGYNPFGPKQGKRIDCESSADLKTLPLIVFWDIRFMFFCSLLFSSHGCWLLYVFLWLSLSHDLSEKQGPKAFPGTDQTASEGNRTTAEACVGPSGKPGKRKGCLSGSKPNIGKATIHQRSLCSI